MSLAAAGAAFIIAVCVAARTASATRPEMGSEGLRVSVGPAANDQDLGGDDVLHATRPAGPKDYLYAIGDSHGDKNYLVRSLLATDLFKLEGTELQWKPEAADKKVASREVVILGDFVDRGTFSKENALLLKTLQADPTKPATTTFTVLMGNHESMLLRKPDYDEYVGKDTRTDGRRQTDWSAEDRDKAVKAKSGDDAALIEWMRQLPVVRLVNGVLLMHGGLSKAVKNELLLKDQKFSPTSVKLCMNKNKVIKGKEAECGDAAMTEINSRAKLFYAALHNCMQEGKDAAACATAHPLPFVLGDKGEEGVLWYRGYSDTNSDAGSVTASNDAEEVAGQFGAQVMVVAHSTHKRITKYPARGSANMVPVYAVDTHFTDCMKTGECDFGTTAAHQFHKGDIDTAAENVPQALMLECAAPQGGMRGYIDSRCLSKVDINGGVTVKCDMGSDGVAVAPETKTKKKK